MKFISPACGDIYYLRMLLRHHPSRSYDDARTVDLIMYDTCHDACVARGIVSNKNEFDVTMMEAIGNRIFSWRLRHLFVVLIQQGHNDPKAMLDKYALYMSIDFYDKRNIALPIRQDDNMSALYPQFMFKNLPDDIKEDLLQALQTLFHDNNLDMSEYHIPEPNASIETELEREKTRYDFDMIKTNLKGITLNQEQQRVIDYIVNHTDNIFIDAPFGRGKSFLLDYIVDYMRVLDFRVVLVCAPTGVMAIARGGFTMHGLVKMNIEPDDAGRLECRVADNSQRAALIRGAHYLIIEEGANASRQVWEAIERTCRDIRKDQDVHFGGLRVITAGDFRQIPPPIKSHNVRDVFNASVKSWPIFQSFTTLHLTTPIRTANDPEWTNFCDSLGSGTAEPVIPDEDGRWTSVDHKTWVGLPDTVKCYDVETQLNNARNWIYPNVNDYDDVIVSALVAVTNKQVDEHNDYFLSQLDTESCVMVSADSILAEMPTDVKCVMSDFTDTMPHNNIPPSKLLIKVNGIYTCMRTINFARKMMNGTIVRILRFNKQYITVHNYTTGVEDDIPRICFDHTINSKSPVKMRRVQFPLRPRYAMTSNIVQGKTIMRMLLDLQYDPFAHGQLHVSCSRVPQASQIRVLIENERIIHNRARTLNVVHPVLLSRNEMHGNEA
jgi:hypothetical protein